MAAGNTTTTAITELIPEITLQIQSIYQDKSVAQALVTNIDRNGQPGLTVEVPRWTAVAGSTTVVETAIPTSHAMDITMPTLTMARRAVYVILGDVAKKAAATGNIALAIGAEMGLAQAKQDDTSIFNILTATTNWGTGTGSVTGALATSFILDALLFLELNEIDDPLYGVLHPKQYNNIRDELTPVISTTISGVPQAGEMLRSAFVTEMLGATWFKTNRISSGTVTSTADVYNGLLFAARGIGYAHSWLEANGVEIERSATDAQSRMIINYVDSAAVIYNSAVCKLYSTSA